MRLIGGATGTIGTRIVRELASGNENFRALVHSQGKAKLVEGKNVAVVIGDMTRPETLAAAFEGVTQAFLLPPLNPEMSKLETNFINAAKGARVRHVVKLSVVGADAEPGITLGKMHREGEKALQASGMEWTLIRPAFFMTNFLQFAPTIKSEGRFYAPAGDGKMAFTDPDDIARAIVKILTTSGHAGKTYTLTGPEALNYHECASKLSAVLGREVSYVDVPEAGAKQGMLQAGMPEWLVNAFLELYGVVRAGYAGAISGDLEALIGQKPASFESWAKNNAQAFR